MIALRHGAVLLYAIVGICLFEPFLAHISNVAQRCELLFFQLQWIPLTCGLIWLGILQYFIFRLKDWLLGILVFFISISFVKAYAEEILATGALTLVLGVTLGQIAKSLSQGVRHETKPRSLINADKVSAHIGNALTSLVMFLAVCAWWHIDERSNPYHGPRWMGIWDNPNDYGMLMGVGLILGTGLLAHQPKTANRKHSIELFMLFAATTILGTGVIFSYSRGSWIGTTIGMLYMTKVYHKCNYKCVVAALFIVTFILFMFWKNTLYSEPWYVQRLDLSHASVQHRIAAWEAGFRIIINHPLGVGWNEVIPIYSENYSPPQGGASAITTNDYVMLGAQLGLPGLLCFLIYVTAQLGTNNINLRQEGIPLLRDKNITICRAGALALAVCFWFDGGLFKLVTASLFWILLGLGAPTINGSTNGWRPAPQLPII